MVDAVALHRTNGWFRQRAPFQAHFRVRIAPLFHVATHTRLIGLRLDICDLLGRAQIVSGAEVVAGSAENNRTHRVILAGGAESPVDFIRGDSSKRIPVVRSV